MIKLGEPSLNDKIIDVFNKHKGYGLTTYDIKKDLNNITSSNTIKYRMEKIGAVRCERKGEQPHYQLPKNLKGAK